MKTLEDFLLSNLNKFYIVEKKNKNNEDEKSSLLYFDNSNDALSILQKEKENPKRKYSYRVIEIKLSNSSNLIYQLKDLGNNDLIGWLS